MTRLAVIVVNYRTPELTIRCIEAIAGARKNFESLRLVVVDGFSQDHSVEAIGGHIAARNLHDWVRFLPLDVNGGFGFANNRAILEIGKDEIPPDYIALINPDAFVRPGALEAMAALLARNPRAGAVGGQLIHEDGRHQSSAFRFPSIRHEFCAGARTRFIERLLRTPPTSIDLDVAGEVPWVTGAAVMLREAALRASGLFDEGFFLYFEETELMLRLRRAGWTVWHEPAALIVHAGGAATNIRDPSTGLLNQKGLPRYWYESRRRYFTRANGSFYAFLSGVAWFAGHLCWVVRRHVRTRRGEARRAQDMLRYGFWPSARDRRDLVVPMEGAARR